MLSVLSTLICFLIFPVQCLNILEQIDDYKQIYYRGPITQKDISEMPIWVPKDIIPLGATKLYVQNDNYFENAGYYLRFTACLKDAKAFFLKYNAKESSFGDEYIELPHRPSWWYKYNTNNTVFMKEENDESLDWTYIIWETDSGTVYFYHYND